MDKIFWINQLKNNLRRFDNIRKIATGQENDYTTSFLFDYNYFNK